jgi:CheY-like chemotaxis protein
MTVSPPAGSLVAIVDDEPFVRSGLRRLCRLLGFETTEFGSGPELLASLAGDAPRPDCILLDAHMPEMTGLEVQRTLNEQRIDIPTIIFTADDAPELRARYLAGGASGFLYKPVGADELLTAIVGAVLKRGVPEELRARWAKVGGWG